MCGVAGIMCMQRSGCNIHENNVLIKKMTDIIAHRGPDGEGQVCLDDGHVFLGHRRLAILDLSNAAKQPMTSLDGRYTLSYNGEVYNYTELKKELIEKGYIFRSSSDTEVVLNAYMEWGTNSFVKLNGIFAFAIWDDYKKELLLVRDRYGAKPLYYAKIDKQLVFASEYKAIIIHPGYKRTLNLQVLKEYFTFQNIFSNNSFFKDIHILESGSYIKADYSTEDIPDAIQYWDYDFTEKNVGLSQEEYEEELDRLFRQAVRRQLISDVSIGSYLSGGIDSASITSVAARSMRYLKTFTCGFDLHSVSGMELNFDEREKAEYMSYKFKTEHYEMVLKAGDMERCMRELVWHLEDPRVGQSYPNFYAAKLSSHFVKVILAGTGGDELFAGYPWRYYRAVGCKDFKEYIDNYYYYWQRLLKHEEMEAVLSPIYEDIKKYSTKKIFENIFCNLQKFEMSPEQSINYSLYLEAKTFLHGLLIVEDKLSMAHSLETRVPFLDNDLVDFAMHLPVGVKLANLNRVVEMNENEYSLKKERYYQRTKDGKLILRNVMKKYIPIEISMGIKQGFSAPDASWFKGESIDYVNSIIGNPNAKIYEFMDRKAVDYIFKKHTEGKENRRLFIWSVLNFEEWLKLFA